ncbi:general substrate transporter [Dactylonectria estremocensis]|uniref:General substrate transporter n=1 Tax=Dactylonectria estremocensis TaxID=1079267 RepID=A0A9P9E314_9HYPO|nr:general substrate transporter [Dactylonectria estremocensis]
MADGATERAAAARAGVKAHTSFTNIVLICSAALASYNYGYSNNVVAGTLAQVTFNKKFLSGSNANMLIDGIVSGFFGAALIGCVVQAYISNRWGRKSVNRVAAVLVAIGNTLQAGAPHIAMFLVGRYVTGLGCGMIITNTPVYLSEISPAHSRGLLVGLQGNFIVFGYISSSCAALGFHFVSEAYQWRLNYIIAAVLGVCLLISLLFLPESPRWLVEVNRPDEAGEILHNIHKTKHDPNGRVARAELSQIVAQVEQDRSQPRSWAFIFRTPSMRKRLVCTLLVWSMAQSTGITVLANLTPRLFGALGYDTILQLTLALIWTVCLFLGCFVNIWLIDRIGRVKLIVAGGWGMAILVAIQAALQSQYLDSSNLAGVRAAVAIYFLIAFYFCCTLECVGYVYGCEIWPTHLRSKGSAISYFGFYVFSIWTTAPAAQAFGSIGWKYYIVFICVTVALTIPCMFMLPETAGMSLEEIAVKFGDEVALDFEQALDTKGGSTHIETANSRSRDTTE